MSRNTGSADEQRSGQSGMACVGWSRIVTYPTNRYLSNKSLPTQQQEELRDARSHRWRGGHWRILRRQDAASRPRHHLSGAAAPCLGSIATPTRVIRQMAMNAVAAISGCNWAVASWIKRDDL